MFISTHGMEVEQTVARSAKHPEWPAPNYVNPITRVPMLMGVSCASGAIMMILMCLRIYSHRILCKRGLGIDDWMMLLAAAFACGLIIVVCVCAAYGTGYHAWDVRDEWYATWGKATFCQNLFFTLAASFTKVSILFTYRSLFPSRANRVFCNSMIVFMAVYCSVNIIVICLQCIPIQAYWDPNAGVSAYWGTSKKRCIQVNDYLYATGSINSATDIIVYLWPSRTLFQLQMPLGRRLGLITIFSIGMIAVVASILKMVALHTSSLTSDSTWEGAFIALWKVLEITFGVKCGCLPALKPIIAPLLPERFRHSSNRTGQSDLKYGSGKFNRLGGTSRSQVSGGYAAGAEEIDLQDTMVLNDERYLEPGRIQVKTETTVIARKLGDSESDEWIVDGNSMRKSG